MVGSDYRLGREQDGRVETGIEGLLGLGCDRILPEEEDLRGILYRFSRPYLLLGCVRCLRLGGGGLSGKVGSQRDDCR